MRGTHVGIVAVSAVVALAAVGCGGGGGGGATESTTTTTTTTSTSSTTTTSGAAMKLVGTDGVAGNPDAFTITLQTADGQDVTTLTPGNYSLEIKDLSTIHNFHLTGPGVDVSSDVGSTSDTTHQITLQDGTYHFQCDPHVSTMNGSFTVSG